MGMKVLDSSDSNSEAEDIKIEFLQDKKLQIDVLMGKIVSPLMTTNCR